jgi:predicted Zn-dependent protease with MMP-like domain
MVCFFKVESSFAQNIVSELDDFQTRQLLDTLDQIGLSNLLKRFPFTSLQFLPEVVYQGRQVNGVYDFKQGIAEIALKREHSDFGASYAKHQFWSISSLAITPEQAVTRTLIHETGHHLHKILRSENKVLYSRTLNLPLSNGISQYATLDPYEYFAECFAAFVYHRTEFLGDDAVGCGIMQKVLEHLGVHVKELP